MPAGQFTQSHPPTLTPPICISKIPLLPPILPTEPPPNMQGFTRWHDWDPLIPLDISAYIKMPRIGAALKWQGSTKIGDITIRLTLEGTYDPNSWTVTIAILDYYPLTEKHAFPAAKLDYDKNWDSGQLLTTYIPALDTRLARITM